MFSDIHVPSYLYRNNVVSNASLIYTQLSNYIPRIIMNLSKYSIIKWLLVQLQINHGWLLMLLVAVI